MFLFFANFCLYYSTAIRLKKWKWLRFHIISQTVFKFSSLNQFVQIFPIQPHQAIQFSPRPIFCFKSIHFFPNSIISLISQLNSHKSLAVSLLTCYNSFFIREPKVHIIPSKIATTYTKLTENPIRTFGEFFIPCDHRRLTLFFLLPGYFNRLILIT